MSVFFLFVVILWIWIGISFYNSVLNRKKVNTKNIDFLPSDEFLAFKRKTHNCMHYLRQKADFKDLYIRSNDHLKLHAYWIKGTSHKWVILVHGYLADAKSLSHLGKYYYERGYYVLMIDLRCHGKSEGYKITMGEKESLDLFAWISYIESKDKKAEILLHGISLGAETVLLSTKYDTKRVKAVISDSAYTSAYDIFYYQLHLRFGILTYPILLSGSCIAKLFSNMSFKEISALKAVSKNKIPTLFIHSKEDDVVPTVMTKALYEKNKSFKEVHYLKGFHGNSSFENFDEYKKILTSFLERYVKD